MTRGRVFSYLAPIVLLGSAVGLQLVSNPSNSALEAKGVLKNLTEDVGVVGYAMDQKLAGHEIVAIVRRQMKMPNWEAIVLGRHGMVPPTDKGLVVGLEEFISRLNAKLEHSKINPSASSNEMYRVITQRFQPYRSHDGKRPKLRLPWLELIDVAVIPNVWPVSRYMNAWKILGVELPLRYYIGFFSFSERRPNQIDPKGAQGYADYRSKAHKERPNRRGLLRDQIKLAALILAPFLICLANAVRLTLRGKAEAGLISWAIGVGGIFLTAFLGLPFIFGLF